MRPMIRMCAIAGALVWADFAGAQGRLHRVVAVTGTQAPGLADGEMLIGFRLPQIDGSGRVAFRATTENQAGDRSTAIYRETDTGLELVAAEGVLLDDGFELTLANLEFTDRTPSRRFPQLTASGFMAFPGTGSSIFPTIPQGLGIWRYHPDGTLERVMLEDEPLPGTELFATPDIRAISTIDGGTSTSLFRIAESGDMLIRVDLEGSGVNRLNNIAIVRADADGSDLRIVVRERDPIPGRPGEEMSEPRAMLLDDGTIMVSVSATSASAGPEGGFRLVRINPDGTRELVFAQNDPLPGFPPGIMLGLLRVDINSSGDVVLSGRLEGGGITPDTESAIFVMRDGQPLQLAYRAGTQLIGMPAGAFFTGFSDAAINDAGTIGFVGGVRETSTTPAFTAYFSERGEMAINPIITLGEQAPGFEPGITISGFRRSFSSQSTTPRPRLSPIGMPAFRGPIDDGSDDLEPPVFYFTASFAGRAIRPLDTGAQVETALGTRTITNSSFDLEGAINRAGQMVAIAVLDDELTGVAVASFRDDCPSDTNSDGLVTPADFNAWILAFNAGAPECDQNGDGLCSPSDFNAWILNYNAGC